jgi:uncharacterized membrane protein
MNDLCVTDIAGNDMISRLFIHASRKKALLLAFLGFTFSLFPIAVSAIEGNFINSSLRLDSSHDYGYYVQLSFGIPILILIIFEYFNAIPTAISGLFENLIIKADKDSISKFYNEARDKIEKGYITAFPYIVSICVTIIGIQSYIFKESETWNTNSQNSGTTLGGYFVIPVVLLMYYLLGLFLSRFFAYCLVLKRLFTEYTLEPQPLHPDKCGGLAAFGKIAMKLNVAIFLFGVIVSLGVYYSTSIVKLPLFHYSNIITLVAYVTIVTSLFFLPLRSAHESIKKQKQMFFRL